MQFHSTSLTALSRSLASAPYRQAAPHFARTYNQRKDRAPAHLRRFMFELATSIIASLIAGALYAQPWHTLPKASVAPAPSTMSLEVDAANTQTPAYCPEFHQARTCLAGLGSATIESMRARVAGGDRGATHE